MNSMKDLAGGEFVCLSDPIIIWEWLEEVCIHVDWSNITEYGVPKGVAKCY